MISTFFETNPANVAVQTKPASKRSLRIFETNPANVAVQTGLQEIVDAIDFETSSGFLPNLTDSLGLSFQGSLQAAVNQRL